ncbi:helix-turn-helix domain-containing protein [Herbiconiux daphne]|uniref:Helix-turn-helix transcriptional regulator n=1 Tax=Herbiconiux daphne TaxID=2970914 RepID=A0ABT2H563_9MICO|nr:helix-turn-helix transcriptional regulator [Herbiconiux daphne]MCS5735033.1 helix-turn-helix transcriptional regulator [Herbiconiux daphne]
MTDQPNALGEFLRAQRGRVTPAAVGLPQIAGRRVGGLRREEVAVLAGVSVDYYTRLEQGRERTPSAQVVDALSTALKLSPDARQHAYRLARLAPRFEPPPAEVSAELLQLMDAFPGAAAYVVDPAFRVIATNATARALLGPTQLAAGGLEYIFLEPSARDYFVEWHVVARASVSALRFAAGFAAPHPAVPPLVERLQQNSADFRSLWADHTVAGLNITEKIIDHPEVGRLELTYQTLDVRDAPGQQLTVATAPAGSSSADALALLGTIDATRRAAR